MAIPIYIPLIYVSVLVGMFYAFTKWQKNSTKVAILTTEPWFPTHRPRDLYISLLSQQQQQQTEKDTTLPPIDDRMLMSALLYRAAEDVRRIHRLSKSKQALAALLQSGSINEDVQARFTSAEEELQAEIVDVVSEANSFRPSWGQWIFQSASEMVGRDKIREVLSNVDKTRAEEERKYKLINPSWQSAIASTPVNPSIQQQQQQQQMQQQQQLQQQQKPAFQITQSPSTKSNANSGTVTPVEELPTQTKESDDTPKTPIKGATGSTTSTPVGSGKKKGKRR